METNPLKMEVCAEKFEGSVMLVTLYLMAVGAWLALTKQISLPPLLRIVSSYFYKRYRGKLEKYVPDQGKCFVASIPPRLISDQEGFSRITLLEDGIPLPCGHAAHEDIRLKGEGRYSHWGAQIYFSSSDNSNPITNGKRYELVEL
ncbi:MAG: hypothetical protein JSR31_05430 [Nitrospira sp.]|nr:hypothetical protein [Nitrospira sp.]